MSYDPDLPSQSRIPQGKDIRTNFIRIVPSGGTPMSCTRLTFLTSLALFAVTFFQFLGPANAYLTGNHNHDLTDAVAYLRATPSSRLDLVGCFWAYRYYPMRDNSVGTVFDLTPLSSYICRVGPGASTTLLTPSFFFATSSCRRGRSKRRPRINGWA